ncbi:aminoglycoside phosphotransferase family protein [Nocardia sp. NBC_00565]|uniref:phosphotransferase n=1 Tax=Nocardia sp. NBC_00565 TaxID=2975993 RepID=UPI002E804CA3|nr:phosphotransferase [Nocardia sp. NBC_00565]WUC07624.1 aminoglycoside phosphotransferase family protein [Nocardia sp. NBC_00565]
MEPQATARRPALAIVRGITRIGGHVAREAVVRPRAVEATDVPVIGREVTADWLTAVLCAGHPGAAVQTFASETASTGTSTRWKLNVTYNEAGRVAGLPENLFAKTTADFKQRLTLDLAGILAGEPGFFKHLRPELDIEAPRGFHSAVDERSGRSISLLEDIVSTKGASFCTPATPIGRAQTEDLLRTMATWHARYWDDQDLERHRWLKPPRAHFANLDRLIGMSKRSQVGARRAATVLPDILPAQHDRLYRALERSLEIASTGPQTFLHGDSHIGNTYITAAGRMGFTDWQVVLRGSWAYDFAYVVSSGLAVADRRAWERDLLTGYLERLAACGAPAPDFDTAWLAYRQQALYPYFIWLSTIGHSAIQPKYQPDEISLGIIERTAMTVLDLEAAQAVEEAR